MFGRIRTIAEEELPKEANTPATDVPADLRYGAVEQVRDFICAYIDRPSATGADAVQQRIDRTTEMLAFAFAKQSEVNSGAGLLDQLIDIATSVVDRHQQEDPSELESVKAAEIAGWITSLHLNPNRVVGQEP